MSAENILAFIPTKSSSLKQKTQLDFKATTFESYKAKPKKTKLDFELNKNDGNKSKQNEFDMKRARHEVLKFGMSGFDSQKKEEAKIRLAISLGARPPKNKYKNYKELQEEKKQKSEEEKKRLDFQQLGKNELGRSTSSTKKFFKRKKEKGGLLDKYGKATLKDGKAIKSQS